MCVCQGVLNATPRWEKEEYWKPFISSFLMCQNSIEDTWSETTQRILHTYPCLTHIVSMPPRIYTCTYLYLCATHSYIASAHRLYAYTALAWGNSVIQTRIPCGLFRCLTTSLRSPPLPVPMPPPAAPPPAPPPHLLPPSPSTTQSRSPHSKSRPWLIPLLPCQVPITTWLFYASRRNNLHLHPARVCTCLRGFLETAYWGGWGR